MRVLVACEESQAVTKEFRAKGHEAYSCDIQECSGGHPEWHCREDVLPLLNGNCKFKTCDGKEHEIKGKWDMVIAFPPCFVAGTKVMTYDGLKNIEDVKAGDKVLTHKGRFRKVKEVMKKQTKRLAKVKTQNSGLIECTPNHPFYTKEVVERDFKWLSPEMFTANTNVCSVSDKERDEDTSFSFNELYLAGRWLGSCDNTDQMIFQEDSDFTKDKLLDIIKEEKYLYSVDAVHGMIRVNDTRLKEVLKEFGYGEEKVIKGKYFRLKEDKAIAFIKGYLDSCHNPEMFYEMKYLINKYERASCSLTSSGINININAKSFDNYIFTPCSVKIEEVVTEVYNLSVEEDESYTANGIVVHNCTHLAVSGAAHFEKKRADGRQREGIEFFCKFFDVDCDKVAIENPVNIISGDYCKKWFPDIAEKYDLPRKPTQRIQPWYWGDNVTKTTCLWLKGLPELVPEVTEEPEMEYKEWIDKNGKKKRQIKWFFDALKETPENRSRIRSKTFPGVAKEMANRWG